MTKPQTHTIFGAGAVGYALARQLVHRGHQVRLVRRSDAGDPAPNLTWMRGDASDPAFALEACRGADVVYNCANPTRYGGWDGVIQPLFTSIREAAGRAGARLVVLDNLYMYGRPATSPFDESTPMNPCSHKGEIRAELARQLFDAHARGDVRAASGRAADFISADSMRAVVFNKRFFERLAAGKSVELVGDPDLPRSYNYVPDVARHLAVLGADPRADGRVWHLPAANHGSTRELVDDLAAAMGVRARTRRIPNWMIRVAGVFSSDIRAANEMMYQWEIPYVIDDRAFRSTFGVGASPIAAIARQVAGDLDLRLADVHAQ